MRRSLLALPVALLLALPAAAADLTVTLTDLRAATGTVSAALVDAAGYAGRAKPVQAQAQASTGDTLALVFKDVAPGRYALMVSHDENGNGRLDTNAMGMPLEGYGFSNNPQVMRKPTFEEAAFDVGDADLALTVEMR